MYAFLSASREYTTRMEESGGYKGSGGHQLDETKEDGKERKSFIVVGGWSVRLGGSCRVERLVLTAALRIE